MSTDASHDLLFGLLALQNGLIDQGQLVAAFQAWTCEKGRPLAAHLAARGDLDDDDRAAVEALVTRHLKKHAGSAVKSLAAIPAARMMQQSLAGVTDRDLAASLAVLASGDEPALTLDVGPVATDAGSVLDRLATELGTAALDGAHVTEHTGRHQVAAGGNGGAGADRSSAGRYRLLGEIARGGMGAVHRGRDMDLGRELALKVLLEKHRDRLDLIERFIEEAQICGQLQHPGVVPVYELGTLADKRPFFAMKLVKGRTLADLMSESGARAGSAEGRPRLLSIFEAICQTVGYAHSRGVIHRDLKPANVMMGSFGEVQVMDWGLAKVLGKPGETPVPERPPTETVVATARSTGDSDLSQAGSVLGTPAYMSPEQARGELERVDRRSDVFALGSILCEILTGEPAFVGDSMREVLDLASRADTAGVVTRLEACGADDEIVALARACLAARPKDRPEDAGVVAGRLTAYLAGVQTRLRAAELAREAERARALEAEAKAAVERRSRRLVAALAATIVLAGGLGAAGWRWVELQRLERVRTAGERVNLALREVTRLRALAQGAPVGELGAWELAAVAAENARDLFEPGIDPSLRKQVEDLAVETAADRNRAEIAALAARRDRTLLETLVDIRSAEADDRGGWSTDEAYAEAFRQAGLDVAVLPEEELTSSIRSRPLDVATALAAALDDWAAIRRDRKKDRAGARALSALATAVDPDAWRVGLRQAMELPERKARLEALRTLAGDASFETLGPVSLDLLGRALVHAGDPAGAEGVLRQAQQHHPADVWINYDLALALKKLARRDEAIRFATAARALRSETAHELAHMLGARGELNQEIAVFEDLRRLRPCDGRHLGCLGRALNNKGRTEEARAILKAAEAAYREAVRLRPNDAMAHRGLGFVFSLERRWEESLEEDRAVLRLQPDDATAHLSLGVSLQNLGHVEEAIAEYRTAIRLDPDDASAHLVLGTALSGLKAKDRLAAAAELREAIRLQPDNAEAHSRLGDVLQSLMMINDALAEYRIAQQIQPSFAMNYARRGNLFDQQGKLDEAIAEDRIALRLNPKLDYANNLLAWALIKKRDLGARERAESVEGARRAVAEKPTDGNYFNTLALAEYRAGHWAESIVAAEHSIALIQGLPSFDWFAATEQSIAQLNKVDASNWFFLAMAHWKQGNRDRARSYFQRAVDWTKKKDPTNVELIQFWQESAELLGEPGPGHDPPSRPPASTPAS